MRLTVQPLTRDRWDDLVELFSRPGGSIVRGCWCMYYRKSGGSGGLDRGHAARGISNRQEGAKSPRLHVVRGQEPLRPRRLPRGRPPKGNEAGRPPRTSTAAGLIRPLICRKLFASWVDRSWKRP